ncbi:hypothetical protein AMJ80_07235 [bacterium SM23_31]|nr:MAG: hypothetical protein AMJ80_07235 [bacterium SM23_31]
MKNRLYFLKCIPIICLSFFLLFFYCSSDVDVQTLEMQPLTDVLTLELSFGDESTISKEEYLLAKPRSIAVNDSGDIFVLDEDRVKVFYSNGKEKAIIGRPGPGPGEFQNPTNIIIGKSGYLLVTEMSDKFNIFSPDYKFVRWINIKQHPPYRQIMKKNDWSSSRAYYVYSYDDNTRVIYFRTHKSNADGNFESGSALIYETPDTVHTLVYSPAAGQIFADNRSETVPYQGDFLFGILNKNRIVFTDTAIDKYSEDDKSYYILHIISLDDLKSTEISLTYKKVELPESRREVPGFVYFRSKAIGDKYTEIISNTKYWPPIRKVITDRNFIFIYTYQKNDEGEYFINIFDIDKNKHICSVYMPVIPNIIKNGYLYRIGENEEGFYVIEKYKIAPAVYGK